MEDDEETKCKICGEEATGRYEGYPVCSQMECEYRIQEGLDYIAEAGAR